MNRRSAPLESKIFEDVASDYDRIACIINSRYQEAHDVQNEAALAYLNATQVKSPVLLDLGCGTGVDAVALGSRNPNLRILGLDIVRAMLERAKDKVAEAGVSGRVFFDKVDVFDESENMLAECLEKAFKLTSCDAAISAYMLHHYGQQQKAQLYRKLFDVLKPGGCLIITDLFQPDDERKREEALRFELDDIQRGLERVRFSNVSDRKREFRRWKEHYQKVNKPTTVEAEICTLEGVGFDCCTVLFQHWQNKVLFVRKPVYCDMRRDFSAILATLHKKLVEISCPSEHRLNRYERLFLDDTQFRFNFYNFFGVSGATFVVADNVSGKFVMLQDGAKDVEEYDVKLSLPITKLPKTADGVWCGSVQEYNVFVNRIFQIQRGHQGLGSYGDRLSLTRKPEFLQYLHPGVPNHHGRPSAVGSESYDWAYCDSATMLEELLAWRWLLWLLNHWGPKFRLDFDLLEMIFHEDLPALEDQYFSASYFSRFAYAGWVERSLPELAIQHLDSIAAWDGNGRFHECWLQVRQMLDGGKKKEANFRSDVSWILSLYGVSKQEDFLNIMQRVQRSFRAPTVAEALSDLHTQARAPLCPYYYYIGIDGRPKEHFVAAILRSEVSKLSFFVGKEREEHTAVVIALASLEAIQNCEASARTEQLLQLRTTMRACADRIIDKLFIGRLVESERKNSKAKSSQVLKVCQYSSMPRVFVLGSYDVKITFYSQQSRALMLARALADAKLLGNEKSQVQVAVVGGGVAGVTVAAGLAVLGCKVTVYDEKQILWIQSQASHRYVHPHIVEWPAKNSLNPDAQLPLLNWEANFADEVVERIAKGFREVQNAFPERLNVVPKTRIRVVMQNGGDRVVVGKSAGETSSFDLAILAIGFKLETLPRSSIGTMRRYWEVDSLGELSTRRPGERKEHVVVVGAGDGGLIDVARAALKQPGEAKSANHKMVIESFASNPLVEKLGQIFRQVDIATERDRMLVSRARYGTFEQKLWEKYSEAFSVGISKAENTKLRTFVGSMARGDTQVTLIHKSESLFKLESLLFNRVVVFLLLKFRVVNAICGDIVMTDPINKVLEVKEFASGLVQRLNCDVLIKRWGINRDYLENRFKSLKGVQRELGGRLIDLEVAVELDKENYEWWLEKIERAGFEK